MTDRLSTLYQDLLSGSYDCVDRIVLNGYFRMGHDPGGFRVWWRALTGSDETLANTYLIRMAGRFSRRVRGYAKAHAIPVIDCPAGQRKHDLAEEYLAKTTVTQGLFLVLVGRGLCAEVGDGLTEEGGVSWGCSSLHFSSKGVDTPCPMLTSLSCFNQGRSPTRSPRCCAMGRAPCWPKLSRPRWPTSSPSISI